MSSPEAVRPSHCSSSGDIPLFFVSGNPRQSPPIDAAQKLLQQCSSFSREIERSSNSWQQPQEGVNLEELNQQLARLMEQLAVLVQAPEEKSEEKGEDEELCQQLLNSTTSLQTISVFEKETNSNTVIEERALEKEVVVTPFSSSCPEIIYSKKQEQQKMMSTSIDMKGPLVSSPFSIDKLLEDIQEGRTKLKTRFRKFVWRNPLSDIETGQPGWIRNQIKAINHATDLLGKVRQKIGDVKEQSKGGGVEMTLEELLTLIKEVNLGESNKHWEDLEVDEELPQENAGENPMLMSILKPDRMVTSGTTVEDYLDRLEVLCVEKHKQLGRSLKCLTNLLEERISAKQESIKQQREKERLRMEAEKAEAEETKRIQDKRDEDWKKADAIARELFDEALGVVQGNVCGFAARVRGCIWQTESLQNLSRLAPRYNVGLYIEALHAHADYEALLKQFHELLEDGFL